MEKSESSVSVYTRPIAHDSLYCLTCPVTMMWFSVGVEAVKSRQMTSCMQLSSWLPVCVHCLCLSAFCPLTVSQTPVQPSVSPCRRMQLPAAPRRSGSSPRKPLGGGRSRDERLTRRMHPASLRCVDHHLLTWGPAGTGSRLRVSGPAAGRRQSAAKLQPCFSGGFVVFLSQEPRGDDHVLITHTSEKKKQCGKISWLLFSPAFT